MTSSISEHEKQPYQVSLKKIYLVEIVFKNNLEKINISTYVICWHLPSIAFVWLSTKPIKMDKQLPKPVQTNLRYFMPKIRYFRWWWKYISLALVEGFNLCHWRYTPCTLYVLCELLSEVNILRFICFWNLYICTLLSW